VRYLLAALIGFVLASSAYARSQKDPYVVAQRSVVVRGDDGELIDERAIDVRNPNDRAVWVYIECEGALTVNPVGVAGRHTSEITLDFVAKNEHCIINHWYFQVPGQSPKPWRP